MRTYTNRPLLWLKVLHLIQTLSRMSFTQGLIPGIKHSQMDEKVYVYFPFPRLSEPSN